MRCPVFELALPPVDTGRSPESANAPSGHARRESYGKQRSPTCRAGTLAGLGHAALGDPGRPTRRWSCPVSRPVHRTNGAAGRTAAKAPAGGFSRLAGSPSWSRTAGRTATVAGPTGGSRRQFHSLLPLFKVPLGPGFASAPRREHLSAAAHGPCPLSEAPSRPNCFTLDDGLVFGHPGRRGCTRSTKPVPAAETGGTGLPTGL
jgi:hypothetical protein